MSHMRAKAKPYAAIIDAICKSERWPLPEAELALITGRRFRCDFVWPAHRLVVEVQGGVFVGGRHSRGMGQVKDMEKLNLLTLAGWRVLQVTPRQVGDGTLADLLREVLAVAA